MVEVKTKEELKKAIKQKQKTIIISDPDLAKHVVSFKKLKKLSKWALGSLLVISAGGIVAAPFTGGTSLPLAGALYSITTSGGMVISTAAIIAIGALSILGIAILYSLWKDYKVEITGDFKEGTKGLKQSFKVTLTR